MLSLLVKTNIYKTLVKIAGGFMINKRLLGLISDSKKYIGLNVLFNFMALISNIAIMVILAYIISEVFNNNGISFYLWIALVAFIALKYLFNVISSKMSYLSSREVKMTLRELIFKKLFTE